ncbi:MAG: alpha-E domain-containing protein [Paracoccaceae bacterium]
MLSRTAENLFWMTRCMERADTMARLLEVGYRISLMPSTGEGHRNEWESILTASGTADAYRRKYGKPVQRDVETFLFFDRENPSSVASCVERARDNARIVRTAITSQVWEALNGAFQDLKRLDRMARSRAELPMLCDWTNSNAAQVRGAIESTQLQQDGYDFMCLGYYLERGDNTARLLDVKYHVLLPTTHRVGGSLDNYQWTTLLRSVSGLRAFHWSYGGDYTPAKIAHFLILNTACPRSLLHCAEQAVHHLERLGRAYGTKTAAQSAARALFARLAEAEIGDIFDDGLHEFLGRFIGENAALAGAVADSYLFGGR